MTREEAIEQLKQIPIHDGVSDNYLKTIYQAIDMAIEASEQQPCEDCISRQAVIDTILESQSSFKNDFASGFFIDKIRDLPSVTPKEKTGHWIVGRVFPTKVGDENLIEYHCSECDRAIRCTESQLVNYPYCHCGARMLEPQESEDNGKSRSNLSVSYRSTWKWYVLLYKLLRKQDV